MDTKEKKTVKTTPKADKTVRKKTPPKKQRPKKTEKPGQEVVYTPPGPFNRNRFLLYLATVIAVVLAILFGMSVFFKVAQTTVYFKTSDVNISGTNKYTAWDIQEASGIQEGENLLSINEARISNNIISKLPYVKEVRVGIKLPGTVKIEITELDVVYAVETDGEEWWLMRSDGGMIEKINAAEADLYTKVLGVKVTAPKAGEKAKPYQPVSEETNPDGTAIPVTVNATQQLETAISILQYLEDNGIIGQAASVDVSSMSSLEVWYGQRFQILLGDATQLSYKIKLVKTAIDGYMKAHDSGVLDVSLTVQPDPEKEYQVIYTPFED